MDSLMKAFAPVVITLIFLGGVGVLIKFLKAGKRGAGPSLPYRKKEALLSAAELAFFTELEKAVGSQYRIFAKVRLWDVIDMERGLDRSERGSAKGKIQSKHVDFVACDPRDMAIRFVVELDDSSHKRADRQERDVFLDQALAAAGVPLVRFPVKRGYDVREICDRIRM